LTKLGKFASPIVILLENRHLLWDMTIRDISSKYKGSLLGVSWSLINPILTLSMFTFVFSIVFNLRWGLTSTETKLDFALILFTGLSVHGLIADVLGRSPEAIKGNSHIIKNIVFKSELLSMVIVLNALFHAALSLIIILVVQIIINHTIHLNSIYIPFILLPFVLLVLGLSWIISAFGVYIQDIRQAIAITVSLLLFLSPVLYSIDMVPDPYKNLLFLNPTTYPITQIREIIFLNQHPNISTFLIYLACSLLSFFSGFFIYSKCKKGFADVL